MNTYGSLSLLTLIIIIFVLSLILNLINERNFFNISKMIKDKKVINFISLVLLIIVIGTMIYLNAFRTIDIGIGGTDAYGYKMFYEGKLLNEHFEIGYKLLVLFFRKITSNYSIFLFFLSLIMIICLMKFLKTNCNKKSFYLIFMLICMYFESFNVLRSILASFLSLLVLIKLNEKNYKKSILIALVCISIHVSSVILLPLIFINYLFENENKIKKVKFIVLILLMCIASFLCCIIMQKILANSSSYSDYLGKGQLVINVYLFFAFIFILSIKNYDKLINFNEFNKVLIISLPISFLIFPMQLIISVLYRMIYFFLPIAYTLMENLLQVEKNIFLKIIIYLFFIYKIIDFIQNCNYLGIL